MGTGSPSDSVPDSRQSSSFLEVFIFIIVIYDFGGPIYRATFRDSKTSQQKSLVAVSGVAETQLAIVFSL